jgi:GT2 family glycosyltransferase
MKLGVIIVSWNSGDCLRQAIASVDAETHAIDGLIWQGIVWDNCSADQSIRSLPALSPHWMIHCSDQNHGFARGNNLAAARLEECHLLLLLNPDARLAPGALGALLNAVQSHDEVAVFGATLLSVRDGETYVDGLGDVMHISGMAWRDGFGRKLSEVKMPSLPYQVFAVSGAAMLIRADAFSKAGGFDTSFFCYQEDVDLSFRLRLMGLKAFQIPQATVYHVGSQSTGGYRSDFSVYHGRRNLVWCYAKNMPVILLLWFVGLHVMLNFAEIIYFSLRGQAAVIWRAKRDALMGLPRIFMNRIKHPSKQTVSTLQILKALDKQIWPFDFKAVRAKEFAPRSVQINSPSKKS